MKHDYYHLDKNHVYINGIIIPDLNPETYISKRTNTDDEQSVNEKKYISIKNNVVFYNDVCKQKNIDPNTVEELNKGYIKDNYNVYWSSMIDCSLQKLENADSNSFKALNNYFGKDKNNVYVGNKKIEGSDPVSFEIIEVPGVSSWGCAKDKNGTYKHPYLTEDKNGDSVDENCNVI